MDSNINVNPEYDKELEFKKFEDNISSILDNIKTLLISKNRKYGNSAITPSRIFSKLDNVSTILVRIDDKLTRIKNIGFDINSDNEDTINDLIGYLVILKYALSLKIGIDVAKDKDYSVISIHYNNIIENIPIDSSLSEEQIEEFRKIVSDFCSRID